MNKVVVTGIGLVTPLGLGREKTWRSLVQGQSAIAYCSGQEILCGRVQNLPVPDEGRLLAMSFLAAAEAMRDAMLDTGAADMERTGCTVSVSKPNLGAAGDLLYSDAFLPSSLGEQLHRIFNLGGPLKNISAACATGADSVILGAQWIEQGICDIVLAGAAESPFHPLYVSGFKQMGVLANNRVSPFDRSREGFALGEGAGVFVLESSEHAMFRGAKNYGTVSGWAMANDASNAVAFEPGGGNIAQAVKKTLLRAGTDSTDYINAHGTATKLNDEIEVRAIKSAFGSKAYDISVSSTKAATGHLLGASGAIELAFCLLALRDQVAPPTLNLSEPDKECDLDLTPREARWREINSALSLSFGFGGQIASIMVSK